jgi:hypothetical protein
MRLGFWRHVHRRWRSQAPSCASPVTGGPVQPIEFWWCRCGQELDSVLTPMGCQLLELGYSTERIAKMASDSYWSGRSHDSRLSLPPYQAGGRFDGGAA